MNLAYVSNISNLVGGEMFEYSDGYAKGVRACRLYNGKFDVVVLLDKAMNLFRASYKGENFSYVTKAGLVSPKLTNTDALPFLQSFDGGLMYTCGLENIGAPSQGQIQHGRISNCPAENVRIERSGEFQEIITLVGEIRQSGLFCQDLVLTRRITLKYNDDNIKIQDTLTNNSFGQGKYVLLYHFNLGYPLIQEGTKFSVNGSKMSPVAPHFEADMNCYETMTSPSPNLEERVFYHQLESDNVVATVTNGRRTLEMTFEKENLPYLVQWKSMASGDYVLGVEPATSKFNDMLKLTPIEPKESKIFEINLKITDN